MADSVEILDFTSGGQTAEEFVKTEKEARAAARGRAGYFSLKDDGDNMIIRFVFDSEPDPANPESGWISTKQHMLIKTKSAPSDKPKDANWPEKASAICRRTPLGANKTPAFPTCYIDGLTNDRGWKETPRVHLWAGAVVREQVVGTEEMAAEGRIHPSQVGKKITIDKMELVDEVDKSGTATGRKVWKRKYIIVNMRLDNFFSSLVSFAKFYETALDRDYRIERKGKQGEKSTYVATPLDPFDVTVERAGQPVQIRYDLREPEVAAIYAEEAKAAGVDRQSLLKRVSMMVSDAWYNFYFDPRAEAKWADRPWASGDDNESGSSDDDAPPPPPASLAKQQSGQSTVSEPTVGVEADRLAAMRAKVMGGAAAPAVAAPLG